MAGFPDSSASIFVVVFLVVLILLQSPRVNSNITEDRRALLAFIDQIVVSKRVSWPRNLTSPCSWTGVACDANGTYVYSLRLPGVALVGNIPPNTLGKLSQLRILSLRSNALSGSIPTDFGGLSQLRRLYLQDNNLSGEIPANVGQLTLLVRLDLSSNNFSGAVPFQLNNLTKLTGLFLENNRFSGHLPSINLKKLSALNVSNNNLNGSIPQSLSKFSESSFSGNKDLCGLPLRKRCKSFFPSPAPSPSVPSPPKGTSGSKLSKAAIIAISVGSALILLLLLLLLLLCLRRRYRSQPAKAQAAAGTRTLAAGEAGPSLSKDDLTGGSSAAEAERNKLVFFEGGVYSFDLEDLLRASAEVLGKGSVGTSYKAVLAEGTTVVVKRLKDVAVTKKEFETQMGVLGRIRHENVVSLRAFYYSSDEKLLVFDYMAAGSLSALLHGMPPPPSKTLTH